VTIQQAFELALGHHQSRRLAEAEAIYRQILAVEPRHADALHLLGVIAGQTGRNDLAVDLIGQVIALKPGDFEAYNNLGVVLRDNGQLDEAIVAYRQAIALKPNYAEAHNNLGNALQDKGQADEAVAAYRQAIALSPNYAEAYINLGNGLLDKGQLDEAIAAYRQAVALNPHLPAAHNNLGNALRDKGQLNEAIASCRQAVALNPRLPAAHNNLGNALQDKGQLDEAIAAHRQAIALKPNYAEAQSNLGNALLAKGQLNAAIAAYRQAIALKPNLPQAYLNLGTALLDTGHLDEAIAAYRQACALKPNNSEAHSNVALALHYHPGVEARAIAEEHERWQRQHAEPLRPFIKPHANDRDPQRRLRVGYVSADFCEHSVAFFLEGVLACHDAGQVEVFCYANVARPDAVTARLQRLAGHWREISRRADVEVAELIRHDQIDILVDLAGHTAGHRLLLFARQPAPVQVSWLGYPDTTGLQAMDYRLTDALADPPGTTEHLHSEQLIRLPESAWCYRPAAEAPPVSVLPALAAGQITFGCFNALPKISGPQLQLWSGILRDVPGSRLLLKNRGLRDPSTQEHLRARLEEAGVAQERIELVAYARNLAEHLALYSRVDIALDTFPYHGTTTTCEALWMGVPVVTLAGKTHTSRVGVSLLTNAGLSELIARSPEEYAQLAATLAGDLPRLSRLRGTLRGRLEQSPLMDAPRFARDIEAAYRTMWRHWCFEK
jgi:predicted O-linked N-acetylglucosamine transferase (SPINDLY family)